MEVDKFFRAQVERLVKQKKFDKMEMMLQDLIKRFQFRDDNNFASVLFEKTGYIIEAIAPEHISVSTRRNLRIGMSGKGNYSLTLVSIEVPAGSGSIYCIKGHYSELKADWVDEHIIEVQIPFIREEVERVNQVRTYSQTITILYKEQ